MEELTFESVINKHFKDERVMYFHSSDRHKMLVGDTYLRYEYEADRVTLWEGGTHFEEFPVKVCSSPEDLEKTITAIVW